MTAEKPELTAPSKKIVLHGTLRFFQAMKKATSGKKGRK